MNDRGELFWHGLPINGMKKEQLIEVVWQLMNPNLEKKKRRHSTGKPDQMAREVELVLQEFGQPMTRGKIIEALRSRNIELSAADKGRYIGTIIWRHKETFINIEGQGYWLRNEPLPVENVA